MKKTFKVSLAVKIPANWEIEIEADSEEEAAKKAAEAFEEDTDSGEIIEDFMDGTVYKDFDLAEDSGVYVTEIEEEIDEEE